MRRDYLSHRIFITFLVPLGFFGFLPCLVNEKTGLLYPCVAIHAANNSIAFCLLFAGLGLADCVGTGRDACACSFCLLACTAEQRRRRVAGRWSSDQRQLGGLQEPPNSHLVSGRLPVRAQRGTSPALYFNRDELAGGAVVVAIACDR